MIRTIPLNQLVPSLRNVRRTTDEQADLELKADIEARGLLQNLVVTGVAKPKNSFAVEAGGRRLRALQSLAEDGKIEKTHEICCLVIEGRPAEAQEASLAENFQRLSMNPADECVAFQQLIEQGSDVEGIARRFGLATRFVEGRLRLANLAPVVFEALGAGEISLDVAKAYAATPDQERQVYVFEQMSQGYGYAHPDSIRRMMTQATASANDRRARFVGEEAYLAAGGRIERDLFADDAATRWLDVAILERLACEKLETLAVEAASEAGIGWVRPTLERWIGYAQTEGLRRVAVESPPLTDEESADVDALEGEIDDLAATLEDEETTNEARDEAEAKIHELNDRIDAIVKKTPVIDDELKPQVGAFLILDERGQPRLDTTYYAEMSPGDEAAPAEGGGGISPEPSAKPGRAAGLSQRLVDELAMQRRDILAVHIAADPGLALDLAIFLMIDREAGYSCEKSGSSVFLMQSYVQNVGAYLGSIVQRTFRMYAYEPNAWFGDWTLFYWGWWISWSPFVGMFIARISRGRTIREFIMGVLLVPSLFTFLWMTVFGNTAIQMDLSGAVDIATTAVNDMPLALFQTLDHLPLSAAASGLATLLVITFFVTSADSGALVIDTITSGDAPNPPVWQRVFWAVGAGVVAAVLLVAGGLQALQTAAIASALPFTLVMVFICYGLLRALQMEGKGAMADLSAVDDRSGDDEIGWQQRLANILHYHERDEVDAFLAGTARNALDAVGAHMRARGLLPAVVQEEDQLAIVVPHERGAFHYTIRIRSFRAPSFAWAESRKMHDAERLHYRAVASSSIGSQSHDVTGYSTDQLINDLLNRYARFRHAWRME